MMHALRDVVSGCSRSIGASGVQSAVSTNLAVLPRERLCRDVVSEASHARLARLAAYSRQFLAGCDVLYRVFAKIGGQVAQI